MDNHDLFRLDNLFGLLQRLFNLVVCPVVGN